MRLLLSRCHQQGQELRCKSRRYENQMQTAKRQQQRLNAVHALQLQHLISESTASPKERLRNDHPPPRKKPPTPTQGQPPPTGTQPAVLLAELTASYLRSCHVIALTSLQQRQRRRTRQCRWRLSRLARVQSRNRLQPHSTGANCRGVTDFMPAIPARSERACACGHVTCLRVTPPLARE